MKIFLTVALLIVCVKGQQQATPLADDAKPPAAAETQDKRAFGVLPNYRTADANAQFKPLTVRRKFYIGMKDSTDYPVFAYAAVFALLYQAENSHPEFGQGMKGYAKRYGASYADQAIGNFMTESIMPSLLREDPRYFRRGSGGVMSRFGYAASRIFVVRTDKGGTRFNFSEVMGNAVTAGIGNAYYRGERKWSDNVQRLSVSLATDSLSQVLKEFWPDIKRKWFQK